MAYLLPYMEEQAVYSLIVFAQPANGDTKSVDDFPEVEQSQPPGFLCPSDFDRMANSGAAPDTPCGQEGIGRSNYRGNGGSDNGSYPDGTKFPVTGYSTDHERNNGIFLANYKVTVKQVTDGLSHTGIFSEMVRGDGTRLSSDTASDWFQVTGSYADPPSTLATTCTALNPLPTGSGQFHCAGRRWFTGDYATSRYNHVMPPNSRSCAYNVQPPGNNTAGGGSMTANQVNEFGSATTASSRHPGGVVFATADAPRTSHPIPSTPSFGPRWDRATVQKRLATTSMRLQLKLRSLLAARTDFDWLIHGHILYRGLSVLLLIMCPIGVVKASSPASTNSKVNRPNVIFILADDLGYGDVGCYGQKRIKTPNVDRMASEGLRFTNAYAGAPVCAPCRCVLMTGLHMGHARIRGNTDYWRRGASLVASDVTVARVLKNAGYSTGVIGKWGLGDVQKAKPGLPTRQGFDYFFGYMRHGHAHNYYPDYLWRDESKVDLPNVISDDPAFHHNVASKKVQYSHDLFADEALKFIGDHKTGRFFLYLAFTIPHANDQAGDHGMEVPDYGAYANLDWPEAQKGHAAMISRMDTDIGRLLALLSELKIDGNTLVIFTSDNGPHREGGNNPDFNDSNGQLRGYKGNVTEGGIREPFIARWPGHVPAGKTTDSPIYFADIMPTFAALGGGNAPAKIDGMDFSPTLFGSEQPELADRFLYWEFNRDGLQAQSSRWKKWKAVREPKMKTIELYDLAADIAEKHNLAKERPEIVAKFDNYFRTARTDSPDWPANPPAGIKASSAVEF